MTIYTVDDVEAFQLIAVGKGLAAGRDNTIMTLHRTRNDHDATEAYFYLVALGIGYLFSFASLTLPVDYWDTLFPTYKGSIEYAISTVYIWVNVVALLFIILWGGVPIFTRRIYGGLFCQFVMLLVIPSSFFLHLGECANYLLIISATVFVSIATSFTASAAIAFTAQYPLEIQSGYQMGIGISTLLGSCFKIIAKLMLPVNSVVTSSILFFYTGALVIVVVAYLYKRLLDLPCSEKYVMYGLAPRDTHARQNREVRRDVELRFLAAELAEGSPLLDKGNSSLTVNYCATKSVPDKKLVLANTVNLLVKIYPSYFPVMIVYGVTLMLWPPLITEIRSFNYPFLEETQWWSLILLFDYAAMDCVGRFFVGYLPSCLNKHNITLFAMLRSLVTIPIICCVKSIIFTNDIFSLLFVAILGISNGYLGSTAIMMVNEWCDTQDEIGRAGVITGFVLNVALAFGALLASLIHYYAI